jgi:hypothetical protein
MSAVLDILRRPKLLRRRVVFALRDVSTAAEAFHRKNPEQVMIPLRTPNNHQTLELTRMTTAAVTLTGTAVKRF